MWWAAAIQGASALFGASKTAGAARDAKRIGNLNADSQEAETKEELRRMKLNNQQQEGYANAVANASGFSVQKGTSQQAYLDEMIAENSRQETFTGAAGRRKANILRRGGNLAYKEGKARAVGGLFDAAGSFAEAAYMWGK